MEYLDGAKRDFLTGCFAKEELQNILGRVKAEADARKKPFSILVLDLDHFKNYNDKYGHLDGDEVLKYFASTMKLSFTEGQCIAVRFGGDEFIIIFPEKGPGEAHTMAKEFAHTLRKRPFLMRGRIFKMDFSGGIVSYPNDGTDIDDLLYKADKAMYYSKMHGRRRTTHYEGIWLKTMKRSVFFILAGAVLIGVAYYILHSEKDLIGRLIGRVRHGVNATISGDHAQDKPGSLDSVYLKSGRIVNGRIIRDTHTLVEVRLQLETGEGSLIIKKSEIERIERNAFPLPQAAPEQKNKLK